MKIHKISHFKNSTEDKIAFKKWVNKLETVNSRNYEYHEVSTYLGFTQIWGINTLSDYENTLVIFPGARTTSLIWDLDRGLDNLPVNLKIFMVETNGLPNLSDGSTPNIKSLDYGYWANQVLDKLKIKNAFIAGASFGGLIAMKLAITNPEKIKAAFLLNPGCLQSFSMGLKNLYYNILPIISATENNVRLFLDKAIFSKPNHQLSQEGEDLLIEYELLALKKFLDKTQKPYHMASELRKANCEVHLLLGDQDLLFPYRKSIDNAKTYLPNIKNIITYNNVGHGIETYIPALEYIGQIINKD